MFDRLRKWAYTWIAEYRDGTATAREWDAVVLAQAEKLNDFNTPLHSSEVRAIARSTGKWCWNKFDIGASNARFSKLQAHRGRKGGEASGVARLAKIEGKRESARLMRAQGHGIRAIAEALGVARSTVGRWVSHEAIIR